MRKSISYLVTILSTVLIVFGLFSCDMDVGVKTPGNETKATGKITGKVMYSNVEGDNHNGIILTLDKTDGLVTQNVMNVMQGRVQTVNIFQNGDSNARVIVANNVTSSNGSYTFENLAEGTYTVYAASSYSAEKAVCTNVVVRAAETTVADVLKLTATGSISGKITLDNGRSGNTGFLVFVAGTSYMAMTDDAGNYTISGVPAGSGYQVVATKNGVIHNLSSNVTVTVNGSAALADNNFTSSEIDNTVQGEKGETGAAGVDGKDGISMVWLGAFDSDDEIENPEYLNAYFNKTDGCSYIYNGSYWELLARSGANGKDGTDGREINWLGSYNDEEELYASCSYYSGEEDEYEYHAYIPQYLDAYFNKTNGCSYIYKNGWQLLAKSGADGVDGKSINWRGYYSSEYEINNPEELDVYFNDTDGCSYIYAGGYWRKLAQKGGNGTAGKNGTDGKGINWLGNYYGEELLYENSSWTDDDGNYHPFTPQYLDAYYNEIDGCSYIYYGCWTLLAKGGNGIKWLGSYSSVSEIDNPKEFDAFFNYTTGCSYIYTEYDGWTLLASKGASGENGRDGTDGNDGENGKSFRWRGSYSSSDNISTPQFMDVYFNNTDGCSYIFDGSNWQILAEKGATGEKGRDGIDGKDGENGKSINWRGSYSSSSDISNPQYLDAYYNTTDGCSYIYVFDGDDYSWCLFAKAGADGLNGTNGINGSDGSDGKDGVGISWLGSFASSDDIISPVYLDAYYNETDGCSYIYTGTQWVLLARAGENGYDSSKKMFMGFDNVVNFASGTPADEIVCSLTNNTTIKLHGPINAAMLTTIKEAIKANSNIQIALDLSDTTGITEWKNWLAGTTRLYAISLPKTIETIQENAFNGCTRLKAITVPCTIQSFIPVDSSVIINFSGTLADWLKCSALVPLEGTLYLDGIEPEPSMVTIPSSVTKIKTRAFYGFTSLTSIIIPDTVTRIEDSAFYGCSGLTSITIPDSVTSIGNNAFRGCTGLTSITIPDSVTSIGNNAFRGCTGLTNIIIPDSVTSIGNYAFDCCTGLTSIRIPNSVTKIENGVFSGCAGLTNIIIPDSVTSIGISAFNGCTGLATITIPNSVTSINSYTFEDCTGLTSITIPDTVTSIGDNAFAGCNNLSTVNYTGTLEQWLGISISSNPCHSADLYINGIKLADITIPDTITSIGPNTFRGCTGLTSISIPDSVTSIGTSAFGDCTGLTSITIPDSVKSIGNFAFEGCYNLSTVNYTGTLEQWLGISFSSNPCHGDLYINGIKLTDITIPDSVTSIGENAFSGCSGLTNITIPDTITSIGYSTFRSCTGLISITIPDSVTSIGSCAFVGCSSLKTINYRGTKEQWQAIGIGHSNFELTNAKIIYNYTGETPDDSGTLEALIY